MGSACQKKSEIITTNQETEQIDFIDMKIDQEIYPIKVHKGFRNTLQKNKQPNKIDEANSLTLVQEELIKYTKKNYCSEKIILPESEQKNENKQIKKKKLKSIIKPHTSFYLIKSTIRLNHYLNKEENEFRSNQRIHSEKQVRFTIPKQKKKSSHSCSMPKSKCRTQKKLNNNQKTHNYIP